VLMNLLDNAVKYSARGEPVRVAANVGEDEVTVSVTDAGQGIPLREQERIFERFLRLENTASRRTQGAGLGLYICRAIVAAHGGRIWVRSELGHGSTFCFSLPVKEKLQEQARQPMVLFGPHDNRDESREASHAVALGQAPVETGERAQSGEHTRQG
jgi:signal transduction histidine kinase